MREFMRLTGLTLSVVLAACASSDSTSTDGSISSPTTPGPSAAISRDEAIEVAFEVLSEAREDWDVVLAEAGLLAQVKPDWEEYEWGRGLPPDLPVWRVVMEAGDLSAEVVLDSIDGSLHGSVIGIAN
jgi:hypothetical protein